MSVVSLNQSSLKDYIYCHSLVRYKRLETREVHIGDVPLGGKNPIRVQSMTTTNTLDTQKTVEQCIRMIDAGCEYIRITAPSIKEAENLKSIKSELKKKGYSAPIIADIHFTPNAAELAARIVEKVRVNPGNYADKKKFEFTEYTEASYQLELERIREKFLPLVKICKEYGTAMRIGTNHGSLSDRILSKYGDTPLGMVESAMEFVRICEEENYHQLVLSMKASNPQVMVQAYRLLVHKMLTNGKVYPLHLGVTEAGDGEDGRIKSSVGIGTLLEDGIGDTIRVSLTEEPEFEIPVAKILANRYSSRDTHDKIVEITGYPIHPYEYTKRSSNEVLNIGASHVPRVITDFSHKQSIAPANLFSVGYQYSVPLDKWNITEMACDYIYVGKNTIDFEIPGTLGVIQDFEIWKSHKTKDRTYPLMNLSEYLNEEIEKCDVLNFISIIVDNITEDELIKLKERKNAVLIVETNNTHAMAHLRWFFTLLIHKQIGCPVIIKRAYQDDGEKVMLYASTDIGGLFIDGLGDGVFMCSKNLSENTKYNSLIFGILQATRTRISKTEYISCPSCGRTLFDLQETTAKIRAVTDHLKGVKIGIMGCIVNGPGEMADADYGYVGTGPGKITLYKQKEVVKRNVPEQEAVQELINLIKEHGD